MYIYYNITNYYIKNKCYWIYYTNIIPCSIAAIRWSCYPNYYHQCLPNGEPWYQQCFNLNKLDSSYMNLVKCIYQY